MPEHSDLSFTPIADIGPRLRDGRLSPAALEEQCLGRIAALDPTLNAFITVTADLAREQARAAERDLRAGHWRGPLHGVPVAVKDFYDTAGIRTTGGPPPFAGMDRGGCAAASCDVARGFTPALAPTRGSMTTPPPDPSPTLHPRPASTLRAVAAAAHHWLRRRRRGAARPVALTPH